MARARTVNPIPHLWVRGKAGYIAEGVRMLQSSLAEQSTRVRRVIADFTVADALEYTSHARANAQMDLYMAVSTGDRVYVLEHDTAWALVRTTRAEGFHEGWCPAAYVGL